MFSPSQNGNLVTNPSKRLLIGDGPHTVSQSTASNMELSELFGPHRVRGRELSEFYQLMICVPK